MARRASQSSRHRPVRCRQVVAICALAQKMCRDGHTVFYARVPRLFADHELAHGDGRFARLFRTLVKADLLILDDCGSAHRQPAPRCRGSTLITSQLPVDKWHDVIGEPTFADAILDRIVHNAYRLDLDGPSMRKLKAADASPGPQQAESEARPSTKEAARSATSPVTKPTKGDQK
jgi:hypothetical protein